MDKKIENRKKTITRRNEAIRKRYHELYNDKRIRHDDCIKKLCNQFYLSEVSINRILSH